MTSLIRRHRLWAAPILAVILLPLLPASSIPRTSAHLTLPPAVRAPDARSPGRMGLPSATLVSLADPPDARCTFDVNPSDPLAVTAAVARWVYCGNGPDSVVTDHGRQVVLAWSGREPRHAAVTVTFLALLDPRSAPVIAEAVLRRPADPVPHQVVATLFRTAGGRWVVDDLTVRDGYRARGRYEVGTSQPIDSAISWHVGHTG